MAKLPHQKGGPDTSPSVDFDPKRDASAATLLDSAPVGSTGAAPADVPTDTRNLCELLRPEAVSYQFNFRDVRGLMDAVPARQVQEATVNLRLAGAALKGPRLTYAADLRFLQVWRLTATMIGDLSSVVALAPGERTTLSIKKTQRTSLTRQDVESSESMQSLENTQIDKDVLNVARSTTKTNQWHVDSTASISMGVELSVSAGYSESTSETSNRSLQRLAEQTRKSAEQLKSLQKTEVTQTTEATEETQAKRQIQNPYRDRSLMLHVFDLSKRFDVSTSLVEVRPTLVLEIPAIVFNRDFVLANADFLQNELLDGSLLEELRSALQTVQQPVSPINEEEAVQMAATALRYLFVEPNVIGNPAAGPNWDIAQSLLGTGQALSDARDNHAGTEFTTLLFYKRLYDGLSTTDREKWVVRIAVGLSDSIGPTWTALEHDRIRDLLDGDHPTEVLRRVSGFLSIVDQLLKPLLNPSDTARQSLDAAERASFVIARAVKHLQFHRDFYVQRFLDYVRRSSDGLTLMRLFSDVLEACGRRALLGSFDPALGFLDGQRFIVPAMRPVPLATGLEWAERLRGAQGKQIEPPHPQREILVVPTDGVHIEAAPGQCVLPDVPDEPLHVNTTFQLTAAGTRDGTDGSAAEA